MRIYIIMTKLIICITQKKFASEWLEILNDIKPLYGNHNTLDP